MARLLLYKKPTWVCEVTGKGSLTYEEALRSEAKARQESMDIFPLPGRSEILSLIHYSRLSFEGNSVNHVVTHPHLAAQASSPSTTL